MTQADIGAEERRRRREDVITNYGGIIPIYGAFYVQAILYASSRAVAAFERFSAAIEDEAADADIVASAHEALGHTAALSRFFFPADNRGLASARAANLRKAFAVDESSALVDRNLRNALEHFDERLDEYLLGDIVGYILPSPMVGEADMADEVVGHVFRLVDPDQEVFVLLGRKHAFGAMRREVERIAERVTKMG